MKILRRGSKRVVDYDDSQYFYGCKICFLDETCEKREREREGEELH
jgi:hypothetical protein